MPVQDELFREFLAVSGQKAPDFAPITFALADLIGQLSDVQRSTAAQRTAAQSAATQSKPQTQTAQSGSESAFEKVLKSGFGVSPIVAGLIDLFKGSDTPPAPLLKFARAPSIAFEAARTRDGLTATDFDQSGMARAFPGTARFANGQGGVTGTGESPGQAGTQQPGQGATQQITVNVQAMDARSFLDRSGDIALAVREAMLNLNSINDVVNEL